MNALSLISYFKTIFLISINLKDIAGDVKKIGINYRSQLISYQFYYIFKVNKNRLLSVIFSSGFYFRI